MAQPTIWLGCDQIKDETEKKQNVVQDKKEPDKSVKVSGVQNSGLFVTVFMNGQPVTCLIDTGATLTIISRKVWEGMVRRTSELTSFGQVISTASGNPKDVKLEDYIKHVQECRQARAPTVITCSVCKAPFSKQA